MGAAAALSRTPKAIRITIPVAAIVSVLAAFGTVKVAGGTSAAPPSAPAAAPDIEPRVRALEQDRTRDGADIRHLREGLAELRSDVKELLRRTPVPPR